MFPDELGETHRLGSQDKKLGELGGSKGGKVAPHQLGPEEGFEGISAQKGGCAELRRDERRES